MVIVTLYYYIVYYTLYYYYIYYYLFGDFFETSLSFYFQMSWSMLHRPDELQTH